MNQLYVPNIKAKGNKAEKEGKKACCVYAPPVQLCYDLKQKEPVLLKNITYNIRVMKGLTCVEVEQVYSTSDIDQAIDLEYLFVINKNAAVTKMIFQLGDKKVMGIIKEQQESIRKYKDGIKQGKTMAYCDYDEEFPEIKRIKIGQLEPQKQLKIIFEYIQPLEVSFNKFYKIDISPIIDDDYKEEDKIDQRLYRYMEQIVNVHAVEYKFTQDFKIYIDTGSKITFYKSPTHSINIRNDFNFKQEIKQLEIGLDENPVNYSPNKKFILLFSTEDINLPTAILSHTSNDAQKYQKYCATLTFVPKFNELPIDDAYQQYLDTSSIGQNAQVKKGNYLFIIDRGEYMGGLRIYKAREALTLFLKSLPEDCLFNIISFGSESNQLWKDSRNYNQETLDEAVTHVESMEANFGGTNIKDTLNSAVFNGNYGKQMDQILNVFLLTGGGDTPGPIIELVKKNNKPDTRVYTLGIGKGCNQYLIKRIAEVGNGKCQFVSDSEEISEKVIDLLEDSITSQLEYFSINCNVSNISQIIPNPESILSFKKNQLFTLQVLFSSDQIRKDFEFNLGWYDPQVQKQILYQVNLNLRDSKANEYFHKLAIHKYITYYEDAQRNGGDKLIQIKANKKVIEDKDLINLSIEHQILSQRTAFICEVCDVEDQFKQQKRKNIIINKQEMIHPHLYEEESVKYWCKYQLEQEETEKTLDYFLIVKYANADGSFAFSPKMISYLYFKVMENSQNIAEQVWYTILALFCLELFCKKQKASWHLVYSKGINYLQKNGIKYREYKGSLMEKFKQLAEAQ